MLLVVSLVDAAVDGHVLTVMVPPLVWQGQMRTATSGSRSVFFESLEILFSFFRHSHTHMPKSTQYVLVSRDGRTHFKKTQTACSLFLGRGSSYIKNLRRRTTDPGPLRVKNVQNVPFFLFLASDTAGIEECVASHSTTGAATTPAPTKDRKRKRSQHDSEKVKKKKERNANGRTDATAPHGGAADVAVPVGQEEEGMKCHQR